MLPSKVIKANEKQCNVFCGKERRGQQLVLKLLSKARRSRLRPRKIKESNVACALRKSTESYLAIWFIVGSMGIWSSKVPLDCSCMELEKAAKFQENHMGPVEHVIGNGGKHTFGGTLGIHMWWREMVCESFTNLGFQALVADIVKYSTKSAWKFHSKGGKVDWCKLVWGPLHIPKHSFISWLAVPVRLSTKKGNWNMVIVIDPACVLCNRNDESRDHLFFFFCDLSRKVWLIMFRKCCLCWTVEWWVSY